ncbi:MFS transporter [Micrococcus lylae]|uniref:MFS transporter n=1 Tax=Micrococcus lylae TaxID=1273 RepID=A0ABY2JZX7_9MICC|nr:MFS transporter [Micrococcus lylae]TFH99597.1 MFS transporter [Micrococcus lylae]
MNTPPLPGPHPAPAHHSGGRAAADLGTRRRLLASNGLDAAGVQLLDTVLAVVVVTSLGFGAAELGLLNALSSLSFVLLAVPIGAATDAWGPARMLVASLATKTVLAGTMLGLYVSGVLSTAAVLVLATLLGVCTVASENAQTAVVPQVTGRDQVSALVSRMAAADAVAGIVAPGGAGLLLALSAPGVPWGVAVGLFVLALVGVRALVRRVSSVGRQDADGGADDVVATDADADVETGDGPDTDGQGLREGCTPEAPRPGLLHGFRIIAGNRLLLATTLLVTAGNIGLAIGDTVEPLLVLRHLDLGPAFFGLLGTVAAVSALAASAVASRITEAVAPRRLFAFGALVQAGVATLPLAAYLRPEAGSVLMALFAALWALTLTVTNVAGAAFAAQTVPPASLGRTFAARRMVTMGCVPVAALGGGLLGELAGLAAPLVLWPALALIAAAAFFLLTRPPQRSSGTSPAEV